MPARLVDGKRIAQEIRQRSEAALQSLAPCRPALAALEVEGAPSGAGVYAASQRKAAESLGILFRHVKLPAGTGPRQLLAAIDALNSDPEVHGILLMRPLPSGIRPNEAACRIRPDKDVEGTHPANLGALLYGSTGLVPCTASAAVQVLAATGVDPKGLETVVVSHSEIVGKPITLLMLQAWSTVTCCHIATSSLETHTRRADILFSAAGVPGLITGKMIKPGAVVIDIGINPVTLDSGDGPRRKVVGDVDFDSVLPVAGWLTPVPGGVGPVTTAVLMHNAVEAARRLA